jgi:transcriptional regulator with XRE-family HTH domain
MTAQAQRDADGVRIGDQLKAARMARRKTLAEVADSAGLTKGFLSKIERDQASASVASLIRICETLGLSVGELFSAPAGNVVRRAAYPPINFGGIGMTEYLLTPNAERRLQAILSEIEPGGGSGDEPYSLPADVEFVFVVSGRLAVTLREEEEIVLEAGDTLTFAPHVPHTFRSAHEEASTQVLWVFSPALSDHT